MQQFQHLVVHCRKAPYDVYCGRKSAGAPKDCSDFEFGNPFTLNSSSERNSRVEQFRQYVLGKEALLRRVRSELKGKRLACWCSPKLCHCHILACIANSQEQTCTKAQLQSYIEYLTTRSNKKAPKGRSSLSHQSKRLQASSGKASTEHVGSPNGKCDEVDNTRDGKRRRRRRRQRQRKGNGEPIQSMIAKAPGVGDNDDNSTTQAPHGRTRDSTPTGAGASGNSTFRTATATTLQEQRAAVKNPNPVLDAGVDVIDIGINITSRQMKRRWRDFVARAEKVGVSQMLLTGTSMESSRESIKIAHMWKKETGRDALFCTIGVHPHDAKHFTNQTPAQMRKMLQDPAAVAVGECGLDYNRNFSSKDQQKAAFEAQIELACELKLPVFVHEREAHQDLCAILDRFRGRLPPIVVHCFTGTEQEALEYVKRGFYIGFTGTICKAQRGAPLRALLPRIPLSRLMVETDAPWMGFVKGRRTSEPADVVLVAQRMAEVLGITLEACATATTANARKFFRLPNRDAQ